MPVPENKGTFRDLPKNQGKGAEPLPSADKKKPLADERLRALGWWKKIMLRPEFGAIAGAVFVFAIFGFAAGNSGMFSLSGILNWGTVSAYLAILAASAAMLMIVGEFDLSIGSMIGFAGMMMAIPALYWGWPVWLAVLFAIAIALFMGALNGSIVVKTALPSFIVTLAFFFILRGLSLALSVLLTGKTIVSSNEERILSDLMAADPIVSLLFKGYVLTGWFDSLAQNGLIEALDSGRAVAIGIPKVMLWSLLVLAVSAFVLAKTRFGNWIFAIGGELQAARNLGIPVKRVKIKLFMYTAFTATLFAILQISETGSAAADRGLQKEFEAIIAAVIGGCLLSGGYGSVIGAGIGAMIFGVVQIGIGYTSIDNNWYRVFLGGMLLAAVLFNNFIRRRVTFSR